MPPDARAVGDITLRVGARLSTTLDLRSVERGPVLLLFLVAAFCGVARVSLYTSANALFLSRWDARMLPYVYIATAVVTTLSGLAYSRIKARVPQGRLFRWTLAGLASSLLLLRGGLLLTDSDWLVLMLPVWSMVVWTFSLLVVWGAANSVFNVQQGKRLFGLIGAGEVLADSLTGLSIGPLVRSLGTENLILVSAFTLALGGLPLRALTKRVRAAAAAEEQRFQRIDYRRLFQSRYIVLIVALSALMNIVYYFVDLSFMREIQRRFTQPELSATFLGRFYAALGLVNFTSRAFISGRLLSRYGMTIGLFSLPFTVGALMAFVAATQASLGSANAGFWLVVGCMFVWIILRDGMDKPSTLLLYQPLPANDRLMAQITVETVCDPVAAGAAGAALVVLSLSPLLGLVHLASLTLVLAIVWLSVAGMLRREYVRALAEALAKRRLSPSAGRVVGAEHLAILKKGLGSAYPGEVIYTLSVLAEMGPAYLDRALPRLLRHESVPVRLEALRQVERGRFVSFRDVVRRLAAQDAAPHVRSAALRALAGLLKEDAVEELRVFLHAEDRELQRGALIGLLEHAGKGGWLAAATRLEELEQSSEPEDRILVAHVLDEVDAPTLYEPLVRLLGDPDLRVRREAVRTAGRLANPQLWSPLAACMAERDIRRQAGAALAGGGETVLPELERILGDAGAERGTQIEALRVVGRIGGPRATELLLAHLRPADAGLRNAALEALQRVHFSADAAHRGQIEELLAAERKALSWDVAANAELAGREETAAITGALEQDLAGGRHRLFLMLSFLYPIRSILDAEAQLRSPSSANRSFAQEALEYILNAQHKQKVLPLLLGGGSGSQFDRSATAPELLGLEGRLRAVLERPLEWSSPWIRACALHSMGRLGHASFRPAVLACLSDPDPLILESAQRALQRLQAAAAPPVPAPKEKPMLTIEKVLTLKSTTFFAGAPDETLAEVAAVLEELEVKSGERIITRGELGTSMYIIVDGEVRIHIDERTITHLGARNVVGELAALDPEPRLASVTALRDTLLLRLDFETLDELISREAGVARAIIRHLCRAFREDRRLVDEVATT